ASSNAASGKFSWMALSSCKQTTSGFDSSSHRSTTGNRALMLFTLYVAIFMQQTYPKKWVLQSQFDGRNETPPVQLRGVTSKGNGLQYIGRIPHFGSYFRIFV